MAYGFARFRFPGRSLLFTLLIATIFLPAGGDDHPDLRALPADRLGRDLAAPAVPAFFANAYDVFLMRQYFLTIPTDLDEAAAIDGAGPFRTLISVILPQSWPVIVAVAVFHLVYTWNDFFGPLLYTAGNPELQTVALGAAAVQRHLLPGARAHPGRDPDDPGHPGHRLPADPALLHPGIVITGVDK